MLRNTKITAVSALALSAVLSGGVIAQTATTTTESPVTTEAPAVTTTTAPVTTEAPAATTEAPAATTEAPAATTEAPAAATEAPAATTEEPAATTEAPAAAPAAVHAPVIEDIAYSFEGPFGKFDEHQLQRGLQVFTEVCSACHGLQYVPIRSLSDEGGPHLPEDQIREYAKNFSVIDKDTKEEREAKPSDNFPANTGAGAPDLSLMAKSRAGFHGPYGSGVNQFFRGIGGPEYIHAILTGYSGEEKEEAGSVFYENHAFSTGWIAMSPPLSDDLVTYADGTPATTDQMARDVSAFLMWAAEPHMMARKQAGFLGVLFLGLLTVLLYLSNKRLWAPHKGKH